MTPRSSCWICPESLRARPRDEASAGAPVGGTRVRGSAQRLQPRRNTREGLETRAVEDVGSGCGVSLRGGLHWQAEALGKGERLDASVPTSVAQMPVAPRPLFSSPLLPAKCPAAPAAPAVPAGRGRQVIAVCKSADLLLMVLDAGKPHYHREILTRELEAVRLVFRLRGGLLHGGGGHVAVCCCSVCC